MSFELVCLIVFVLGMSIAVFVDEAVAKRVIQIIAAIGGILWTIVEIITSIR